MTMKIRDATHIRSDNLAFFDIWPDVLNTKIAGYPDNYGVVKYF
jgi:hypothetical protein